MDPDRTDFMISDVVRSLAGRDAEDLFYVIGTEGDLLLLCDGKHRTLEKPKRKKTTKKVAVEAAPAEEAPKKAPRKRTAKKTAEE